MWTRFIVLLFVFFVIADGTCFVGLNGSDSDGCGSVEDPCFSIGSCLEGNDTRTDIAIFPGVYKGQNNCNLKIVEWVQMTGLNSSISNPTPVTIDCQGASRHVDILHPYPAFNNIRFLNGRAVDGGCISITYREPNLQANAHFNNCTFENCRATHNGGAMITSWIHKAFLYGVTFIGSHAANEGGALYLADSSVIVDSRFINNTASRGGAIYVNDEFYTGSSTFISNQASYGGAIYLNLRSYDITIHQCTFFYNNGGYGGTFFVTSVNPNCTFVMNQINVTENYGIEGAAIAIDPSTVSPVRFYAVESIFQRNKASDGGFLFLASNSTHPETPAWRENIILKNIAIRGSDIFISDSGVKKSQLTLPGIQLEGNFDENSGRIFCDVSSDVDIPFCLPCQDDTCQFCNTGTCSYNGTVAMCYSSQEGCMEIQLEPGKPVGKGFAAWKLTVIVASCLIGLAMLGVIGYQMYRWKMLHQRHPDNFVEMSDEISVE